MKAHFLKNKWLLLIIAVDILLIASVFSLMNFVQALLDKDVRINLTEIVTQNKSVIESKLKVELNNLEMAAQQLSERFRLVENLNEETMQKEFLQYVKEKSDTSLVWATKEGVAISGVGKEFDISGRNYFQIAIDGSPNISDRLVSRLTGEDVFTFSVPLLLNNEIIGTIQKQYTPQEMYALCSVSLFLEKGSSYIINGQGYILISSANSEYNRESDNYYRIVYLNDADASRKLAEDVKNNRSGFMETVIEQEKVFFTYTPIENIHDWYLISSVSTDAVSPNANAVVKLFYCVLFATTLLFTCSMFYYHRLKLTQQKNLEKTAFVDRVTNGISYTKFTVDLRNLLEDEDDKSFSICFFDIDNFKYINRFYGFEQGDRILKAIYTHYRDKIEKHERIARVTGDHFVLLLQDVSQDRLEKLLEDEIVIDSIKIYLSFGVYQIKDTDERVDLMVDKASTASHKNKGMHFKTIEFYSEDLDKETARTEQLKRKMEEAIQKDEIIAFFQPKVNVETRELVGAEALARWQTQDGKLVPPGDFIPFCEKIGFITLIDMVVFEKTLQFIKKNLDQGIPCVPISVNFSRLHLLNTNFVQTVLDMLEKYQVPAELIEMELTETVIYDNYQTISGFIEEIHKHGLKISMDDFGTGYSSLHMLKDLELDIIKIDRGFLKDTLSNKRQKTIFGAIAQMAKQLEMKVVVEGVETQENVELMKEFGCLYAQGYFYSKPVDEATFESIYTEGKIC